ncbi:hypothetical protein Ddye_028222 [Dipteronia dyeriana]|uniref:TF-B3 domain-containing protein n=1 Tax=Dipteronia dyeriana TaxID=168575 RepID=A0AAD9WS52_9ROSI|nr:hypothetical protein Ddye_028222 [Dipteronia dyeriana]
MEIFSKLLTISDVTSGLLIPTEALLHIPIPKGGRHHMGLVVNDSIGQVWKFHLYPNSHDTLAFTEGWLEFVKAKGVREGDKVIFSTGNNQDGAILHEYYCIVVMRSPFTFQGEPIYMDVEELPRKRLPIPTTEIIFFK